jgi:hypothetical protein
MAVAGGTVALLVATAIPAVAAAADPTQFVPLSGSTYGSWTATDLEVSGTDLAWLATTDLVSIPDEPDGGSYYYDDKIWQYDGSGWTMLPAAPGWFTWFVPPPVVTGSATDDVWMFRYREVLHYDGSAWGPVTSFGHNSADAVALSRTNVWSTGSTVFADGTTTAGVAHWNGTTWAMTKLPTASGSTVTLTGIEAKGPNDIWVTGTTSTSSRSSVYLAHWNGSSWSNVSPPATGNTQLYIKAVHARGSSEIWVGGHTYTNPGNSAKAVAYRLVGSTWTTFTPAGQSLTSFADDGPDLLAAISGASTSLQRLNGTTWVSHPGGSASFGITHIAGIPGGGAWVAGSGYIDNKRVPNLGKLPGGIRP